MLVLIMLDPLIENANLVNLIHGGPKCCSGTVPAPPFCNENQQTERFRRKGNKESQQVVFTSS